MMSCITYYTFSVAVVRMGEEKQYRLWSIYFCCYGLAIWAFIIGTI